MFLSVIRTTGPAPKDDMYVLVAAGFDDGGQTSLSDSKED